MVSLARMGEAPPCTLLDKAATAMQTNLAAYDPKVQENKGEKIERVLIQIYALFVCNGTDDLPAQHSTRTSIHHAQPPCTGNGLHDQLFGKVWTRG